ncbi:AAA family ATPase [Actinomadura decatromicini]|uniref:AAA family ATPase n=1 Tax=Actinomadura decatromicini TaxID=2604572 RepID=A0A5D3F9V5_9ACTN|nr:AAA family ATPase [Actinomadura decatromicini]TYK44125.1 AAA family ATPase [Actinomadura decatromicini]
MTELVDFYWMPDAWFVGREDLLAELTTATGEQRIHQVVGGAGTGKSSLLFQAGRRLASSGLVVGYISASRIAATTAGTSDAQARTTLSWCCTAARLIATDLADAHVTDAARQKRTQDAANRIVDAVWRAERMSDPKYRGANGSGPDVPEEAAAARPEGLLRHLFDEVREALSGCEAQTDGHAGLAVLIDEFDRVEGTPTAEWLLSLLVELPASVRIIARRPGGPVPEGVVRLLPPLSRSDVADYQRVRLPSSGHLDRHIAETVEMTRGYALAVGMATDLYAAYGDGLDLRRAFDRARPEGPGTSSWLDAIGAALDRLLDDLWRPASWTRDQGGLRLLDRLSVVRRFDEPLLAALLQDTGAEAAEVSALQSVLRHQSFVVGFDDDLEQGLRLHEAVRSRRERALLDQDLAFYRRIHGYAAGHAERLLNAFETDEDDALYRTWHRYEHPEWHVLQTDWLFHLARSDAEPQTVDLAFARVFFDAFWWFGEAVPFPLCDEILDRFEDMPHTNESPASREWLRHLRQFRGSFPSTLRPEYAEAKQWERSWEALQGMSALLDRAARTIRQDSPEDDNVMHVRGLIQTYVAEVGAHLGQPLEEVLAAYHEARTTFDYLEEEWCVLWIDYMSADVMCAPQYPGHLDEAERQIGPLEARIAEQAEYELRVLLAETLAEIRWQRAFEVPPSEAAGRLRAALDAHARAVMHAYVFNTRQEMPDQAPSEYTRVLYESRMDHARARMRDLNLISEDGSRDGELRAAARREHEAALVRMDRLFRPYWAHVRQAEGGASAGPRTAGGDPLDGIFPPPPTSADLNTRSSPFADAVRHFLRVRRRELDDRSVSAPLP